MSMEVLHRSLKEQMLGIRSAVEAILVVEVIVVGEMAALVVVVMEAALIFWRWRMRPSSSWRFSQSRPRVPG